MPNNKKQSTPPFLPPDDVPMFGRKRSSSPLIEFIPGLSLKYTLYAYTFGMCGPWLITSVSGVLLTASLAYWFAPEHAGVVVRYFMPESIQSGWDTVSGFRDWVRSLGDK